MSLQLAKKTKDLAAAEEEKKSITSQYAAKVNELKANCNVLSNKVTDGYEMLDVECTVKYHFPEKNKKTYIRSDGGPSFTEPMEQSDHTLFNQESNVNDDDEGFLGRHSYKNKRKK